MWTCTVFVTLKHLTLRGLIKQIGGRGCSGNSWKFLQLLSAPPSLTCIEELIIVLAKSKFSQMTKLPTCPNTGCGLSHVNQVSIPTCQVGKMLVKKSSADLGIFFFFFLWHKNSKWKMTTKIKNASVWEMWLNMCTNYSRVWVSHHVTDCDQCSMPPHTPLFFFLNVVFSCKLEKETEAERWCDSLKFWRDFWNKLHNTIFNDGETDSEIDGGNRSGSVTHWQEKRRDIRTSDRWRKWWWQDKNRR